MSGSIPRGILEVVESARQREQLELAEAWQIQAARVIAKTASGGGDIDETFSLNLHFRLVYVRCHFVGGSGTSELGLSVDSSQGPAYDTRLFTVRIAGAGADLNFRLTGRETAMPSPWTLQPGDVFRINWTNPDPGNMTWGLEVGMAPA
ncbi:MAG: hypothetical protein ACYS7M_09415 [Planctomycetota bacterium]|jgi:hypothetical protein